MRKQFKRNICFLITMLLVATMLSACSSAKTEEAPKQEVQQVEVAKQEVQQEEVKEEVVEEQAVSQPEPEPEPEPEPIVYEGIDMESTLPGVEWMGTFEGIIEEPKLVVFNDTTNKKVIIEEGQEVKFETDDILGLYFPEGTTTIVKEDGDTFKSISYGRFLTMDTISGRYKNEEKLITNTVIEFKGEEMTLTATLILK